MDEVLCVGEALIDIVATPDGQVREHVGGSPLNVAAGLARLGFEVSLLTWIGRDERGSAITEWAQQYGVRLAEGSDGAVRTPTARAELDEQGRASYDFDITWQVPHLDADLTTGLAHVHVGSIAAFLDPGASELIDWLTRLDPATTISFDPNIRPALVGGHEQAVERTEAIIARSHLVKASDEDIAWLYPGVPLATVLTDWSTLGDPVLSRPVVATLGPDGAVLVHQGELLSAEPRPTSVVDTVGAGDSFMAGLVAGMADAGVLGRGHDQNAGLTRDDALRALGLALSTAAITVGRAGAYPPTRAEAMADREAGQ